MEDLPPGFRFYPTEEELVSFYLRNKLDGTRENLLRLLDRIIPVLDIYEFNPWQLPQFAGEIRDSEQWFFFIPRQKSEARGGRPQRLTTTGYWKATGSAGQVYSNNRSIAVKRTMVFYRGRAPNGRKTEWKMNEYKAIEEASSSSSSSSGATPHPKVRQEFSLCRIYKKPNSLRAFDRRPQMEIIGEIRAHRPQYPAGNETTTTTTITMSNNQIADMVVDRTVGSLPDGSSSSGDPGNNNLSHQNHGEVSGSMPMSIDSAPWWDWEQLELYYDGDQDLQFD